MGTHLSNCQSTRRGAICYAMPLRAIGQALEALQIEAFNLEKDGADYLVRGWTRTQPREGLPSRSATDGDIALDKESPSGELPGEQETCDVGPLHCGLELRFSSEDLELLEREGQERRSIPHEMPDGHSKPELLRAAGDYVDQRDAQLLGISWRDQSISIVYETLEGRRELDVFSLSSMHDFWMLMCLRREAASSQIAVRA